MGWRAAASNLGSTFRIPAGLLVSISGPVLVAVGYYAGAMLAFGVGTLSDRIFAPFWPPNVILFYALLLAPARRWPLYLGAAIPSHVAAETWIGMAYGPMLVAFVTNCAVAMLAAWALRRLAGPLRHGDFREMLLYMLVAAGLAPAVAALGGAFVPILGGGSLAGYWSFWAHWYVGNALGFLTLGALLVTWSGPLPSGLTSSLRLAEAGILSVVLVAACVFTVRLGGSLTTSAFLPVIIYLPVPFILWAAMRFGERGASAAVLIVAVVSTWGSLNGPSLFLASNPEDTVLAVQLYLVSIAITVLLLGASIDELHAAERRTRWLARSVLEARDEERRSIARDLHDSTGQQLVAATMLVDRISEQEVPQCASALIGQLRDSIRQSIQEIRTLSYLLHPPLLDEGGLKLALENFIEGFTRRSGIKVDLDLPFNPGRLPRTAQLILFRVVQEALTNVSRHSGSATARISLKRGRRPSTATLVVEDFGRGFPGSAGPIRLGFPGDVPPQGLGLTSMNERLDQIGGRLEIVSRAGRTTIRTTIPL